MRQEEIRILIAERNPRVRTFLGREFANRDFRVEGAGNSDEVFEALAATEPPHLVILDVNTPDKTGGALLLRLVEEFPEVPVILHGYLEDLPDDASLSRVQAMVEKDGNPDALADAVLETLQRLYPDADTESAHG